MLTQEDFGQLLCFVFERRRIMAGLKIRYTYINENGVEAKGSKTLPKDTTAITNDIFDIEERVNVVTVVVPMGITKIDRWAFYGFKCLLNVTIPKGIYTIEDFAFSGCKKLLKAIIPEGTWRIGICAFEGCEKLSNVKIPTSVKRIAAKAFNGCPKMKHFIRVSRDTVIDYEAFHGNYDRIRYYDS